MHSGEINMAKDTIYHEGLKAIAEKRGISLKGALEIALEDIKQTGGAEHVEPTRKAYRDLTK